MGNLRERYNALENDVKQSLINAINKSDVEATHIYTKAIKVNVFIYVELVFWDGELTFLDRLGYRYNLFSECNLEDLIEILENIEK